MKARNGRGLQQRRDSVYELDNITCNCSSLDVYLYI